jgi:hypothetical protein
VFAAIGVTSTKSGCNILYNSFSITRHRTDTFMAMLLEDLNCPPAPARDKLKEEIVRLAPLGVQ